MGAQSLKFQLRSPRKIKNRRKYTQLPSPSLGTLPGLRKRSQCVWVVQVARVHAAARGITHGITRRITRSMTKAAQANARVQTPMESRTSSRLSTKALYAPSTCGASPLLALQASPSTSPVYLPRALRRIIPPMDEFGPQNCGQHGNRTKPATAAVLVGCRDCHVRFPVAVLHCLPCGHVLCRDCLRQAVVRTDALLHEPDSWAAIEQCMYDCVYETTILSPAGSDSDEASPAPRSTPATATAAERLLDAMRLTCCGRFMQLDRHIACLDPGTAASYWVVHELLRWPLLDDEQVVQHRCGWPDCRRLLAPTCEFVRDHSAFFHCVRCQGNSVYVRPGYLSPAAQCDATGR